MLKSTHVLLLFIFATSGTPQLLIVFFSVSIAHSRQNVVSYSARNGCAAARVLISGRFDAGARRKLPRGGHPVTRVRSHTKKLDSNGQSLSKKKAKVSALTRASRRELRTAHSPRRSARCDCLAAASMRRAATFFLLALHGLPGSRSDDVAPVAACSGVLSTPPGSHDGASVAPPSSLPPSSLARPPPPPPRVASSDDADQEGRPASPSRPQNTSRATSRTCLGDSGVTDPALTEPLRELPPGWTWRMVLGSGKAPMCSWPFESRDAKDPLEALAAQAEGPAEAQTCAWAADTWPGPGPSLELGAEPLRIDVPVLSPEDARRLLQRGAADLGAAPSHSLGCAHSFLSRHTQLTQAAALLCGRLCPPAPPRRQPPSTPPFSPPFLTPPRSSPTSPTAARQRWCCRRTRTSTRTRTRTRAPRGATGPPRATQSPWTSTRRTWWSSWSRRATCATFRPRSGRVPAAFRPRAHGRQHPFPARALEERLRFG